MLATKLVVSFLKKNGPSSFDEIWKNIKDELIVTISKELDEATIKSDLHFSMIEDKNIIMMGHNKWDLSENFSLEETAEIQKKVLGDELEKVSLVDSDTKEIKMELEEIEKENEGK